MLAVKWLPLSESIFSTSPNQAIMWSKRSLTTPLAVLDRGIASTQLVKGSTVTSKYFKQPTKVTLYNAPECSQRALILDFSPWKLFSQSLLIHFSAS
jgi:hypothetical protein